MDDTTIETIKSLAIPVITAIIALLGTLYTTHHSKPFESIKTLSEALKTLKEINNPDDDTKKAIQSIESRLKTEAQKIAPFPSWVGVTLATIGIVLIAACAVIPSPRWGVTVLIIGIGLTAASWYVIPRTKA